MQEQKTISRLLGAIIAIIKEGSPSLLNFTIPTVELGKYADLNISLNYPAVFVFRGPASYEYLAINNLLNYQIKNAQRDHISLIRFPIIIDVIDTNYIRNEIVSDTIAKLILSSNRLLIKTFNLHSVSNPSITEPEISEEGHKIYRNRIQFMVEKESKWKEGPLGELIENILINIKEDI